MKARKSTKRIGAADERNFYEIRRKKKEIKPFVHITKRPDIKSFFIYDENEMDLTEVEEEKSFEDELYDKYSEEDSNETQDYN